MFLKSFATMNRYLDYFVECKATTYGLMLDANVFYGRIMQKLPLLVGQYEMVGTGLDAILKAGID